MKTNSLLFDSSDSLVREIYKMSLDLPYKFQSSVGDQLRRSSLSIVLNIVEGGARRSLKEKRQATNIAFGSLKETKYLVYFTKEMNLIDDEFYNASMSKINNLAKILYGLLYKGKRK